MRDHIIRIKLSNAEAQHQRMWRLSCEGCGMDATTDQPMAWVHAHMRVEHNAPGPWRVEDPGEAGEA